MSVVALAVLAAGCSSDEPRPRGERQTAAPTQATETSARDPISQVQLAKLAAFLKKVEFVSQIGARFELRYVQYTSPTDAVAEYEGLKSGDTVIATTDDNWAHASRLLIDWDLADLVSYVPLGHGRSRSKPRVSTQVFRRRLSCCTQAGR